VEVRTLLGFRGLVSCAFVAVCTTVPRAAYGEGTPAKAVFYGLHSSPSGTDAKEFSDDGWGLGANI